MSRLTCIDSVGNISTAPRGDRKSDRYGTQECLEKLYAYEEIGYTPEELNLFINIPDALYVIDEDKTIVKIYPVDGEQLEISNGDIYFNCFDENNDYYEQPISGLGIDYFLDFESALQALTEMYRNGE